MHDQAESLLCDAQADCSDARKSEELRFVCATGLQCQLVGYADRTDQNRASPDFLPQLALEGRPCSSPLEVRSNVAEGAWIRETTFHADDQRRAGVQLYVLRPGHER
jgi:hypothetical protein